MAAKKIKKVSPYPIPVVLTGAETVQGRIPKLTNVGFLVETERPLTLGTQLSITFVLPVLNKNIQATGVVIKTYARYGGEPGKEKSSMLNEIHFKTILEEDRVAVTKFLVTIRQV